MAIAAVPAYLGKDFSTASPGLRFGMYLPLWGVESRTGELLWTTHDVNYRATGPQNLERRFDDKNKTAALGNALRLNANDLATLAALARRQSALAAPIAAQGALLAWHALAIAPFTTGLGNEHPLENGFAFLNPYGLPYLPGSGVKGVLRQAARELADHLWGDDQGWNEAAVTALFGKAGQTGDDAAADGDNDAGFQRGALTFWDVIPQIEGDALKVEVMTPHQSHYYQNGDTPHESGQPNPINFLTVPPKSKFAFHVQCDLPFLARLAPWLALDSRWQQLVTAALTHAFEWLGFGAKTAVGYGAMAADSARQSQVDNDRANAEREAKRESMRPSQLSIEDFTQAMQARTEQLKGGKDKPNTEFHQRAQKLAKTALDGADWTPAEKSAAADAIEAWLPKVVQLPDVKDALKKLKLRALRGLV